MQDERTQQLIGLMQQYNLSDADVAQIVGAAETTVAIWRCKNPARIIPERAMRLLELVMQVRTGKVRA